MIPTRDGSLDAVAWLQAHLDGDTEGRDAIAHNCDPVELVTHLTGMHLALVNVATHGQPQLYMKLLRETLDGFLDTFDRIRDDDQ